MCWNAEEIRDNGDDDYEKSAKNGHVVQYVPIQLIRLVVAQTQDRRQRDARDRQTQHEQKRLQRIPIW